MFNRPATESDRNFKSCLDALQVEQKTLNLKTKADRARAHQIAVEFYAIKSAWRVSTNDAPLTKIEW